MKAAALTFPLFASALSGANALLRHGANSENMEIVSSKPIERELDWDYEVERPEIVEDRPSEEGTPNLRQREMGACSSNEENVRLTFNTDKWGSDTEWELTKNGNLIDSVATGTYKGDTKYQETYCLKANKDYSLTVKDQFGDGMCCGTGNGSYKVQVQKSNGGWQTLADGGQFGKQETKDFTIPDFSSSSVAQVTQVPSSNSNSGSSNSSPSGISLAGFTSRMGCSSGQRKVKMDITVDMYGAETTWKLFESGSNSPVMQSKNGGTYSANESESKEMCLNAGQYELMLYDGVGDGICCNYGQGSYTLSIEDDGRWDAVIEGGNFKKSSISHFIYLGSTFMSDRDEEWLVAHNSRRKIFHQQYGKSYVPLKWSEGLQKSAEAYAEKLLNSCDSSTIVHDPNNSYGENMAKNKGTGDWGALKPADNILTRFVDREVNVAYPGNAHLTQALWRASKYVGCGEAVKDHNGGLCRIQVCRYSKPGNCGINANTWESKMLEDNSGCEPACPPEGCS